MGRIRGLRLGFVITCMGVRRSVLGFILILVSSFLVCVGFWDQWLTRFHSPDFSALGALRNELARERRGGGVSVLVVLLGGQSVFDFFSYLAISVIDRMFLGLRSIMFGADIG